jgi:hypothetical protein
MKKLPVIMTAALMLSGTAFADATRSYKVTITNITAGQIFTPVLAVTHKSSLALFELGEPASPSLELLAENGMTGPLEDVLLSMPDRVRDTAVAEAPLMPGQSVTLEIMGSNKIRYVSFAAMMLPTHDNFVAIDAVPLPWTYSTVYAKAYDAGTEDNDELCVNIPGPPCMGANVDDASGEGYVHIANGIHGVADLDPILHDWRNPVAKVTIERVY